MAKATAAQSWASTNDTNYMTSLDTARALFGARAAASLTNGGTVSYVSGCVKWTDVFVNLNGAKGTEHLTGANGISYVYMPAVGVNVQIMGGATVAVTANGIPLTNAQTLWWDALTYGCVIVDPSTGPVNFTPPSSWIWVCGIWNNPVYHAKFANGLVVTSGQSSTIVDLTAKSSTAQAQALTDDTTIMTPLKTGQAQATLAPKLAKARAQIAGATGAINESNNVSSVTRSAAGSYVVTLPAGVIANTNAAVEVSCSWTAAGVPLITNYVIDSATTIRVYCWNNTNRLADPISLSIAIFGN